ncbi:hypothetical protein RHMOL_Rhmol09G0179300 [Rhododendron molle]|nr:hypothetical protein RHMOL_Rhmol09G0179300 [Rhododendron molle]
MLMGRGREYEWEGAGNGALHFNLVAGLPNVRSFYAEKEEMRTTMGSSSSRAKPLFVEKGSPTTGFPSTNQVGSPHRQILPEEVVTFRSTPSFAAFIFVFK